MRARPSAPTTHCFLLPTRYSLLVPFVVHLHLRQRTAQLPCRRARARQPRTTFYPLLPTLFKKNIRVHSCPFVVLLSALSWFSWFSWFPSSMYARHDCRAGAPERANHALPSTLFSLLSFKKDIRGPFVSIRGSIIPPFVYFVYFVVHPFLNVRTAIFAVLNGSPLHSDHALLSTFSSLLSTRIMLYKVP